MPANEPECYFPLPFTGYAGRPPLVTVLQPPDEWGRSVLRVWKGPEYLGEIPWRRYPGRSYAAEWQGPKEDRYLEVVMPDGTVHEVCAIFWTMAPGEWPRAAAAIQREADAAGHGRISMADRVAAEYVGEKLGIGFSRHAWRSEAAHVSRLCRATGSGFGVALAEALEGWAGSEDA